MPLSDPQLAALAQAAAATLLACSDEPLGNLLEGRLKVAIVNRLVLNGYGVLEGSNISGQGRHVFLRDGRLQQTIVARPVIPARPGSEKAKNSPDIRVWSPIQLVLELQARSSFGTQAALFSSNIEDDLNRIDRKAADAFILAADLEVYDSLRGIKKDTRGRKSIHCFDQDFPASDTLPLLLSQPLKGLERNGRFVAGIRCRSAFGTDRIILVVWSAI